LCIAVLCRARTFAPGGARPASLHKEHNEISPFHFRANRRGGAVQHTEQSRRSLTPEFNMHFVSPRSSSPLAPRGIPARFLGFCALAFAALLCRSATAQYFHYDTTLTLSNITPTQNSLSGNGTDTVDLQTDLGTDIHFLALDSSGLGMAHFDSTGIGTDITLGSIDVDLIFGTPFENLSFDFAYHFLLTDFPTNFGGVSDGTTMFDITGSLSGTIGPDFKLNLNAITVDPIPQQIVGGDIYTISFQASGFTAPSFFPGAIAVHVSSVPVPEPATITLLAIGTLGLATPAIRRWRRKPRRRGSR
jgi:hypothetical protein